MGIARGRDQSNRIFLVYKNPFTFIKSLINTAFEFTYERIYKNEKNYKFN